ncbi:ComEA family DNA-binding protein [Geomonas sp.]|nr:helix-hairpin-helix domain-containing protein [Geomonas sp.]HJV36381.1 helix-hairpin-helix domain-containing protein [Geomonas sp.]
MGPVLAARIVADRQKNGAFGSLEGVQRVPGVGPGKLASLRRYFLSP